MEKVVHMKEQMDNVSGKMEILMKDQKMLAIDNT